MRSCYGCCRHFQRLCYAPFTLTALPLLAVMRRRHADAYAFAIALRRDYAYATAFDVESLLAFILRYALERRC